MRFHISKIMLIFFIYKEVIYLISQTSDPDIETIFSRITKGIYDLQPDFQRGEVWDVGKKRKLIDTILREWHIPPIHLVYIKDTGTHEVLDGQQRLATIRDFIKDEFTIDGKEIPLDPSILVLDGLRFSELPVKIKNKFLEYTIRVFLIKEYSPEEPGELFYRLNQSTTLSPAEQRNSFYGIPRNQIKQLSSFMQELGLDKNVLGFSNARMAHDDMIAKVCFTLENKTFKRPASSKNITAKYRSGEPFVDQAIHRTYDSLKIFNHCRKQFKSNIRFNKPTMYSLLCFIAQLESIHYKTDIDFLGRFIYEFEITKNTQAVYLHGSAIYNIPKNITESLLNIYNDRASYRAENISSIRLRDLILWFLLFITFDSFKNYYPEEYQQLSLLLEKVSTSESESGLSYILEEFLEDDWRNVL